MKGNRMTKQFLFKPANHWNYITESQYDVLIRFCDADRLMIKCEGVK